MSRLPMDAGSALRARAQARLRRFACSAVNRGWAWAQSHGHISAESPCGLRFARLGEGACIAFPAGAIFGEQWISIGDHTLVGAQVSISAGYATGQDLGPEVVVDIGQRCSVGRGSHIVGHRSLHIGNDVFIAPYVYITDQNHTYLDPGQPIGGQWPQNVPVFIGDGCWIGTGAIILPGVRLGRNTVVAGGAVVRGQFPDHCVLAGVPARVVRRYDPEHGWQSVGATERQ
ncbi:acyltransferase [Streptomyces sp. NBC_01465]|uniref:acyltransferase n=1 Tax=Streptomyces sp. NBC_01465 TaxID=2903878 RepID=UPI002E377F92|nr:acyltransferase [Streptomyces sp. NBC_01465]